jgi:amino acid adenylation domain-containing protein
MIKACGIRWMLAGGDIDTLLADIVVAEPTRRLAIGWLDHDEPRSVSVEFRVDDLSVYSADPVRVRNRSFHPAHVVFTSGTTAPRGVVMTHRNVMHTIEWATRYFGLEAGDRVSCHSPLHLDLSLVDLFSAAAVGAELHLVPPLVSVLPNNLATFIRASAITHWSSVPSVLSHMAQFDLVGDFPALKQVAWVGDSLSRSSLMHWTTRLPHVRFTRLYGSTESGIVSAAYAVPARAEDVPSSIPIGTACTGQELVVLGASLDVIAAGEVGDLYIGGGGVARGYWDDLARTNAAFVRHPVNPQQRLFRTGDRARMDATGMVHLEGRRDGQIKTRGYRVELAEIESALSSIDDVKDSAIVALDHRGLDGALICCAYVPKAARSCNPITLRRQLSQLVPSYMLPVHWMPSDSLPVGGNGKVDRLRLKSLFEQRIGVAQRQSA